MTERARIARTTRKAVESWSLPLGDVHVIVERKAVRNLNIRVRRDGTVFASVPKGMPRGEAERLIRSKEPWIRTRVGAVREAHAMAADSEVVPVRLSLWGTWREVRHETDPRGRYAARLDGDVVVIRTPEDPNAEGVARAIRALLKDEVARKLPAVAERCEARVGKHASAWRLHDTRTRWGSCNTRTGAINICIRLAHFDPRCLEQVVTHELCHLIVARHDDAFYREMTRSLPTWREAHALLNMRVRENRARVWEPPA